MDQYTNREKVVLKQIWKFSMRLFGYLLIIFFILLFFGIFYSFVYDTVYFYHCYYRNLFITSSILLIGIYLGFNIVFNYVLVIIVSPGQTNQLFVSQKTDPTRNTPPFVYDPSRSIFNTSQLTVRLDQSTLKFCHKCQLPKPERTHHCSICDKCVFKMDHHCPWIAQCVGHLNHRYFLLFLLYIFLGTTYVDILNLNILITKNFGEFYYMRTSLWSVIWPLNYSLALMLGAFSLWNWYLAITGFTAIEFWDKGRVKTFERKYRIENLRTIFGNVNNWIQITAPSVRNLLSNGVIWEFDHPPTQPIQTEEEGTILDVDVDVVVDRQGDIELLL